MLLRGVRIARIHDWSWDDNRCTLTLQGCDDNEAWQAPLPPLASPCVLYAVWVDGPKRTIEDWVHEAPEWVPVPILDHLPEEALKAVRTTLRLPADAPRERISEVARGRDVQIVSGMGVWRGTFDGEGLRTEKRARLFDNWTAFGRHESRCFSMPHAIVLATDTDPLDMQQSDFSRSRDPKLRRLSLAAPAWRAIRLARLGGASLSKDCIIKEFGQTSYDIVSGRMIETVARVYRPVAETGRALPPVVFVGGAANLCFSHAPGGVPEDTIVWFASCIVVAARHPRKRSFLVPEQLKVNAYAVHEHVGAVYVLSASGVEATCSDGRVVSRGGLTYVGQPTAAEGGCELFESGSLRKVGVYCPRGDGTSWSTSLVRRVLDLVALDGHLHTNCVSTRFLTGL
jgi:hypothetical protein